MTGGKRAYDFQVSEYFFKLTSESIRLFSNSVLRHCPLDEVVEARVDRACELAESYDKEDFQAHLRLIPADGDIALSVTILETSAETIESAIPALKEALGESVRFVEVISMMLFDVVVERNATEVLTKLGLSSKDAKQYRMSLKRRVSNVIPFK